MHVGAMCYSIPITIWLDEVSSNSSYHMVLIQLQIVPMAENEIKRKEALNEDGTTHISHKPYSSH